MRLIGQELEDVNNRDAPLNKILREMTIHQLEQAILLEKGLPKVHATGSNDYKQSLKKIINKFESLADKTDVEIHDAEDMTQAFLKETTSDAKIAAFNDIFSQLKTIEKHHVAYKKHALSILKNLQSGKQLDKQMIADIEVVEREQTELDHEVEALLGQVGDMTIASMEKALADEIRALNLITTLTIIIVILSLIFCFFLARSVTRPVGVLTKRMSTMASGNIDIDIPENYFQDEINDMTQAMKVFQRSEHKQRKRQSELNQLVGIFGATINSVFERILASSNSMVQMSDSMNKQSNESLQLATQVSEDAQESSDNAQSLSAATEEMTATANEINSQIIASSEVVKEAVQIADSSQENVKKLSDTAAEIGNVIELITTIADKTNLLALNATIEAASAGEAEKGFAVVATEVKELANQTGKAIEEVSSKITAIQSASNESSKAFNSIGESIQSVDEYINSIVAAVEEQTATTEEMAKASMYSLIIQLVFLKAFKAFKA